MNLGETTRKKKREGGGSVSKDINARIRKINSKMVSIANRIGRREYAKLLRKENRTTFKGELRL